MSKILLGVGPTKINKDALKQQKMYLEKSRYVNLIFEI